MKRKIFTIVLSMSLIFLQAVPAFAENTDDAENETAIKSEDNEEFVINNKDSLI